MAVLCCVTCVECPQYCIWLEALLSEHKLFNSCIQQCLMSCACDRVMSVLSAMLRIYSYQFRPAFLPR